MHLKCFGRPHRSRLIRASGSFRHAAYQNEPEGLRDQFRLALSEHPPEGLPPVAELAEKIEALRAANPVESTQERTVRKAARAERQVVARIRERMTQETTPVVKRGEPPVAAIVVKKAPVDEPPAAPPAAVIVMPEPFNPVNGHA
jgi:hypothetical protein